MQNSCAHVFPADFQLTNRYLLSNENRRLHFVECVSVDLCSAFGCVSVRECVCVYVRATARLPIEKHTTKLFAVHYFYAIRLRQLQQNAM